MLFDYIKKWIHQNYSFYEKKYLFNRYFDDSKIRQEIRKENDKDINKEKKKMNR